MKMNFKNLMMTAILAVGLVSCSSDDDNVQGGGSGVVTKDPKNVSLTLKFGKNTTYADGNSAIGLTPNLTDAKVYFADGDGVIVFQGAVAESESGPYVFRVPGSATNVYVVGNTSTITTLPTVTIGSTTLSTVKQSLNNIEAQTHPVTAVTLQGAGIITGADGAYTCGVTVSPAVSRIEIIQIEGAATATNGITIPLTSFQLDGIFINNTYSKLGLDYTTLPSVAGDIINFSQNNAAAFDGTYLASLRDFNAAGLGVNASLVKNPVGAVWGYQVFPLATATGTTIDEEAQSKVPHVILRITNPRSDNYVYPSETMFLTVKKFVTDDENETEVTEFLEGKVYKISNIRFGGEHLSARPEVSSSSEITVTVTVKTWEEAAIKPEL